MIMIETFSDMEDVSFLFACGAPCSMVTIHGLQRSISEEKFLTG